MDVKDLNQMYKAVDAASVDDPPIFLISGTDLTLFDLVVERVKKRLAKSVDSYETTIFTGESGDELRFHEEVFNIPLFVPHRMIVVHRADVIFKPALSSAKTLERYIEDFQKIPDRTFLVLEHAGVPPAKLLKIFDGKLVHFATRELFENRVIDVIRDLEKRLHMRLDDEAILELRERIEPRAGAIEQAMTRMKSLLPHNSDGTVTGEDIREVLFPVPGINPFRMVDAIFERNHGAVRRELLRWNSSTDNIFTILKLMLNRTDEIRRARVGYSHGMNDEEVLKLLNLDKRPPFVKKKITRRLHGEITAFDGRVIDGIYEMLMDMQTEFRMQTPPSKHLLVFEEKIFRVIFTDVA